MNDDMIGGPVERSCKPSTKGTLWFSWMSALERVAMHPIWEESNWNFLLAMYVDEGE
jgi:hypothetical protein